MNIYEIISLIITATVLAFALYKTIKAVIQLTKEKDIVPMLLKYIEEAEATNKSGKEKLEYVIAHIQDYAALKGIKIDIQYLATLITRIVETTKKVNINKL